MDTFFCYCVSDLWDAGTTKCKSETTFVFSSSYLFFQQPCASWSHRWLWLLLHNLYCICCVYVWNTFLRVRVRVVREGVNGLVNALCQCYMCVKHLLLIGVVSALDVAHPHHQFQAAKLLKLKRLSKAREKDTLNLLRHNWTLRHDRPIRISHFSTYQRLFQSVSIPFNLFLWPRCFSRGPACSICLP